MVRIWHSFHALSNPAPGSQSSWMCPHQDLNITSAPGEMMWVGGWGGSCKEEAKSPTLTLQSGVPTWRDWLSVLVWAYAGSVKENLLSEICSEIWDCLWPGIPSPTQFFCLSYSRVNFFITSAEGKQVLNIKTICVKLRPPWFICVNLLSSRVKIICK